MGVLAKTELPWPLHPEQCLTRQQTGRVLGVSTVTVDRLRAARELIGYKVGARRRFRYGEILEYLARHRDGASPSVLSTPYRVEPITDFEVQPVGECEPGSDPPQPYAPSGAVPCPGALVPLCEEEPDGEEGPF